jgi:hypothetical protein
LGALAITSNSSETKDKGNSKEANLLSPTASAYASLVIYNQIVVNVNLNSKKADGKVAEKTQENSKSSA